MSTRNGTHGGSDSADRYQQGSTADQQRARRMLETPPPTTGRGQSAVQDRDPGPMKPAVPLPTE